MAQNESGGFHGTREDEARVREVLEAIRQDLQPLMEGLVRDLAPVLRKELFDGKERDPRIKHSAGDHEAPAALSHSLASRGAWYRPVVVTVACALSFTAGLFVVLLLRDRAAAAEPSAPASAVVDPKSTATHRTIFELLQNELAWPEFVRAGGLKPLMARLEDQTRRAGERGITVSASDKKLLQTYQKAPDSLSWKEEQQIVRLARDLVIGATNDVEDALQELTKYYLEPRGVTLRDLRAQKANLSNREWVDILTHVVLSDHARK
jgi:hypothetical protein